MAKVNTSKMQHDEMVATGKDENQRDKIYKYICTVPGEVSSRAIADYLKIDPAGIASRMTELYRRGLIEIVGTEVSPVTGATVRTYRGVPEFLAKPREKKATRNELVNEIIKLKSRIKELTGEWPT